jgi:Ser/Thr protein kinase RdoA (MazF antagonist)
MTDVASARRVATRFGGKSISACGVSLGHIHDTFFVDCATGQYVLQRLNTSVFEDVGALTSNLLAVHRHLGHGVVPCPVPAIDGSWTVQEGEEVWRAFERVNAAAPVATSSPGSAREAGRLLGTFHARLDDLGEEQLVETIPGFHDLRRRTERMCEVAEADPLGRAQSVRDEVETLAEAGASLIRIAEDFVRHTPVRISHNDAKLDNFLFREGTAVCLVDLDTVMPGRRFWDVGDLLRTAATTAKEDASESDAKVDPLLYEAVIDGYRQGVSSSSSTSGEVAALEVAGALVAYEQSVRFLTDWIEGDHYYRTKRPKQNLDRARVQLSLLSSMPVR